jgi:haloalkane dehalogenase
MMDFLRTPESRFNGIPDFPYAPQYLSHGKLRMAYIDESSGSGPQETFLCLHGQPTWSYLYRKMIPILLHRSTTTRPTSRRVLAPDLFGFGRSDKPTDESVYTFDFHRESLLHFIRILDLQNITLVVQDWGGILGLTLPVEEPWRFQRLLVMNTDIPVGRNPGKGFLAWRDYSNRTPDMDVGALLGRSCSNLSAAEKAAYNAPYPDSRYKAGVRRFPNLVMIDPAMPGVETARRALSFYQSTDQFKAEDIFMACGMQDPVLGAPVMRGLSKTWKNGCYYTEVKDAGHFVQEWGEVVASRAIQVFENAAAASAEVQKVGREGARL